MHVAFVRGEDVERHRAEGRVARLLEDDGLAAVVQAQATVLAGDVGREEARRPRLGDQLTAQGLFRAVGALARVVFQGVTSSAMKARTRS